MHHGGHCIGRASIGDGVAYAKPPAMPALNARASLLFGTAAVAAIGFAALARVVSSGGTRNWDRRAKRRLHQTRGPAVIVAAKTTKPLGKWWGHVPAAFLSAARLRAAGRSAAAATVAGTSLGAALIPLLLERVVARRLPPPERLEPTKQSFPSGHALQTSAVALATTYVMRREKLGAPGWVASLGPLSLATGVSRLLLDRHWTSDVLGGYCAGIALGATCAGLYEVCRTSA